MELYLDPIPKKHWRKITWTEEMLLTLRDKFPFTYNKILAKELNVSWRSLVRKARELGIDKEPGFLDKNRSEISIMAVKAHPPNPFKGAKGWSIPGGEKHQFQKGNIGPTFNNPNLVELIHIKRKETIKSERIRIRYGIPQKTKLKLVNY